MKKLMRVLVCLIATAVAAATMGGCANNKVEGVIAIYAPDGAPALALAKLMYEDDDLGRETEYHVVSADTIGTLVASGTADAAILPVNAAAKLCGDGEKYKMLSVNTHGNLFVIGIAEAASAEDLLGKKVGVVNLANVPGLTFKSILRDASVAYTEDASAASSENVLLVGIAPTEIAGRLTSSESTKLDFVVAPEPAVSTLTSKAPAIKVRMSLQKMWGEGGYPQAVLVASSTVCADRELVDSLLSALDASAAWLPSHPEDAVTAIAAHLAEGLSPSFTAANLTPQVIDGCNIRVQRAAQAKDAVKAYIAKILEINSLSSSAPTDAFFFG